MILLKVLGLIYMSGVILVWLGRHVLILFVKKSDLFVRPLFPEESSTEANLPSVSVIIPARNEEKNIGRCLLSVLAQDYPDLEIIVVDDRSNDRTAEIVREIFRDYVANPRAFERKRVSSSPGKSVKLVQIDHLPEGWTGKNYALAEAARQASGDWFLFLDADTTHHPANILAAIRYARRKGADMLSLLPGQMNIGFWERLLLPLLGSMLMIRFPIYSVNDQKKVRCAFANGQYILIRKEAYEAIDGHTSVRSELLEDIAMAKRLKATRRFRLKVAFGSDVSMVRMYSSLGEIWRGWQRIFLAGLGRSVFSLLFSVLLMFVFSLIPFTVFATTSVMLLSGAASSSVWLFWWLSIVQIALLYTVMYRTFGISRVDRSLLPLYPLAGLFGAAILFSTLRKAVRGEEITWRGTDYSHAPNTSSRRH